jgi:hypothetical protein
VGKTRKEMKKTMSHKSEMVPSPAEILSKNRTDDFAS